MLQNAYFLAKFRFATAENEPAKNLQNFANFPNFPNPNPNPPGRSARAHRRPRPGPGPAERPAGRFRRRRGGGRSTRRAHHFGQFRQNLARFRLYRLRFLQENMRFAAFCKIYQILKLKFLKFDKILQILRHLQFFAEISRKLLFFQTDFLRKF